MRVPKTTQNVGGVSSGIETKCRAVELARPVAIDFEPGVAEISARKNTCSPPMAAPNGLNRQSRRIDIGAE